MTLDSTSLLLDLNPAPERHLTPDELARREYLLREVLADRPGVAALPATRQRSRLVLWATAGVTAVATIAAAVVVAPPLLRMLTGNGGGSQLTAADISSWTRTAVLLQPGAEDGRALQKVCTKLGDPRNTGQRTAVSSELRGRVGSLIMRQGGEYSLCMAGRDGGGFAELLDQPATVTANQVRPMTGGGHGQGDVGFDYAAGRAGDAVTQVVLTTDGRTVDAHLENGWWTAWWPNSHAIPGDPKPQTITITVTLRDGTSRTGPLTYE